MMILENYLKNGIGLTEYPNNEQANIIHYTLGTPCFKDYRDTEMSDIWLKKHKRVNDGMEE